MNEESEIALEDISPIQRMDTVYRTITLLKDNLENILIHRAYADLTRSKLEAAILELEENDNVSPSAFISISFQARPEYPTPFPPGRYGNGSYPVFYAALDELTSTKERGHYFLKRARSDGLSRAFTVFVCKFSGHSVDITGREKQHPELVSHDESGYPFCQNVAVNLKRSTDGLLAPSARNRPDGACTPIFSEQSLSEPHFLYWVVFSVDGDSYKREVLGPTLVS